MTKQEIVHQLVRDNQHLSRQQMISMIIEQASMSRAGASTYYYNAKKVIEQDQTQSVREQPLARQALSTSVSRSPDLIERALEISHRYVDRSKIVDIGLTDQ